MRCGFTVRNQNRHGPSRARGIINLTVGGFAVETRQFGALVIYLTGFLVRMRRAENIWTD